MNAQVDVSYGYKPTGGGNVFLPCDGFGISFNPSPGMGFSFFAGDDDRGETAIVVDDKFFILNGDFRAEYAQLANEGINACLRFFASKPELISSWSGSADEALARCGDAA